jgi:phosphoenolpyruvate carboxylase
MWENSLFLYSSLLDLVETVMAKAEPRVTAMYDAKLVQPELQVRLIVYRQAACSRMPQ